MSQKGTFASIGSKLGLWTDDGAPATSAPVPAAPSAAPSPMTAPFSVVTGTRADDQMVSSLKTKVLGASPILEQFMQNIEVARSQFPGDETACMRAALAFTRVDKTALLGELDRTVAAALLHAKKGTENERKHARENAVGALEKDLASVNADIQQAEKEIAELQQTAAQKRAAVGELQNRIRDAEADLLQQDSVVNASFAQVEQFTVLLKQTLAKL